jgi:hypothetical protein
MKDFLHTDQEQLLEDHCHLLFLDFVALTSSPMTDKLEWISVHGGVDMENCDMVCWFVEGEKGGQHPGQFFWTLPCRRMSTRVWEEGKTEKRSGWHCQP